MKKIVMTTALDRPAIMGAAGAFETGIPKQVDDDKLADALLKRDFPKFKEVSAENVAAAAPKAAKSAQGGNNE